MASVLQVYFPNKRRQILISAEYKWGIRSHLLTIPPRKHLLVSTPGARIDPWSAVCQTDVLRITSLAPLEKG